MRATPTCLDWKIVYRTPLPTWVSKSGKIALIGDAAHPHLPTSAQGASQVPFLFAARDPSLGFAALMNLTASLQATEDGACLAICLELAGKGNVRLATLVYERLRYGRVLKTQKTGEDTRSRWHNALRDLDAGVAVDPESVKMQVRSPFLPSFLLQSQTRSYFSQNAWIYELDTEFDTRLRFPALAAQITAELATGNPPVLPASLLGDDRHDIPTITDDRKKEIPGIVEDHVRELEKTGPIYRGLKRAVGGAAAGVGEKEGRERVGVEVPVGVGVTV